MRAEDSKPGRLWPFLLWLAAFYSAWLLLVSTGGRWEVVKDHWPIAVAMGLGSYVAGSTPMGGGTVGFPVLVLLFDFPSSLGRNFALAIQSIGMVSATVYILAARRPLDWGLLRPALRGMLVGVPVGAAFVAPVLPDLWVKLLFAVLWASFGVMHLIKMRELVSATSDPTLPRPYERPVGYAVGLLGGVVAAVTGVGIDMLLYAVLVLLYRSDLKTAVPTSVVIMAAASLVGILTNAALAQLAPSRYAIDPEVFANWLAAAPIVALGAPIGALVVNLIPRTPTLVIVSLLCVGQYVWTVIDQRVTGVPLVASLVAVLVIEAIFRKLYLWGKTPRASGELPG
jgi:uncharacterized membrane protein YfcA